MASRGEPQLVHIRQGRIPPANGGAQGERWAGPRRRSQVAQGTAGARAGGRRPRLRCSSLPVAGNLPAMHLPLAAAFGLLLLLLLLPPPATVTSRKPPMCHKCRTLVDKFKQVGGRRARGSGAGRGLAGFTADHRAGATSSTGDGQHGQEEFRRRQHSLGGEVSVQVRIQVGAQLRGLAATPVNSGSVQASGTRKNPLDGGHLVIVHLCLWPLSSLWFQHSLQPLLCALRHTERPFHAHTHRGRLFENTD